MWQFRLLNGYLGQPLIFKWYIVANKETRHPSGGSTELPDTDFFHKRTPSVVGDLQTDFGPGFSRHWYDVHTINSDKYMVLKKGKFALSKNNVAQIKDPKDNRVAGTDFALINNPYSGGGNKQGDQFMQIKQYIALNTQMRFDFTGDTYPDDYNLYFVYFAYQGDKLSTQDDPSAVFVETHDVTTYFKEHDIN